MVSTLERTLRAIVRPFVRPFLRPIFRRIEEAERRIDEVNYLAVRLDQHLPTIQNVIESQNAQLRSRAREEADVRAELGRLNDDLVRTQKQIEVLLEDFALAFTARPPTAVVPVEPVEPASIARLRQLLGDQSGDLRLNFGCGPRAAPDHVDVDIRELESIGVVAGLRNLPLSEGSAAEIRATLALERFSVAELREDVLPYWHWLLKPGGSFVAVTIDAEANLSDYRAGQLSFEEMAKLSLGVHEDSATSHRSMLSEDLLGRLLDEAGFQSIETVARWRTKDAANQIEVRAKRSAQTSKPSRSPLGLAPARD